MSSNKVIVVGGGLSGLTAAHTLLERGASVLLLDKMGFMGGNSTKATSGINGAGTQSQIELDIKDTAKIFFDDTKLSAKDLARDDLIKVLTYRSADAVLWLQEKFGLDLSKVSRLGGHSQPRTHRGGAQFPGMTITYAQMEKLEDYATSIPDRVTILKKARVTQLLKQDGKVIGVEFERDGKLHKELGPVILATGGYAADFGDNSLLKKYRPDVYHLPTTNGDHSTGDGLKIAMAIGGKGVDLDKVQVHPTGLVDPKEPDAHLKFLAAEALRGVGGILLDNEGQRFCDELGRRDYVTGEMNKNGKFPIRLLLNGQASKEIEWHVKHYEGRKLMKYFKTGHDLAKEMGISSDVLKKTFEKYNEVGANNSDPYGKRFFPGGKFTIDDEYHVAHMTPVLHYTMGGLEIDSSSRVMNEDGEHIPGVFACGELAGGVHGSNRLGGSSLLGCVVFGRVAGDTAASYLVSSMANETANQRLGAVAGHLLQAKVTIAPGSKVSIEVLDGDADSDFSKLSSKSSSPSASSSAAAPPPAYKAQEEPKAQKGINPKEGDKMVAGTEQEERVDSGNVPKEKNTAKGSYSIDEVAKHNTKEDCWVMISGEVLDVTKFLSDHPGGEKAILLYAGRDATEEFLMLHDPKVIPRYAADTVIGKVA
ncbi:fumarate reductase [Phaffia rhodozyma]|uniref:Fumarate reductase n=1 Tax=Phaffia rhodozyma TaxID=264483 RepID=A0A0F7SKM1_PHARH|nr:fumarate reductase [Phaffia rhodozyma]